MNPLNGTKTHPLSSAALADLAMIGQSRRPSQSINPGVVNRLMREDLVETVQLASPYPSHKGRTIAHLQITDAGRAALAKATA